MILDKYTIISNSCVGFMVFADFYGGVHPASISYTNPFVSSLFLSDDEFIKFCSGYDRYMSITPVFDEPSLSSTWCKQTKNIRMTSPTQYPVLYPVMKLDDVDVHWIHKADVDIPRILLKFNKRYNDGKHLKRIFVWSAAEIFNKHTDEERKYLIDTFLSIKDNSVFLTNRKNELFEDEQHISVFIPEWEEKDEDDRRIDTILKWDDQAFISRTLRSVIEKKFL